MTVWRDVIKREGNNSIDRSKKEGYKDYSLERQVVWIKNLDTQKVRERLIESFWNVEMVQYGEYQLKGSKL